METKHEGPRTGKCATCGARVRPGPDQSLGAATRIHYWKEHPELMLTGKMPRNGEGGVAGVVAS